MARIAVLWRDPPYRRDRGVDLLDAALAAIAFEHELTALFVGDGVLLLRAGQAPEALGLKRWTDGFRALPHHGAARIGVEAAALARYRLAPAELMLAAETLDDAQLARWIADSDVVLGG